MTHLLEHPRVSLDGWTRDMPMNILPEWSSITPEEQANKGREWGHDPGNDPWNDAVQAEQRLASWLQDGRITEDEAVLLRSWVYDGYFVLEDALTPEEEPLLDEYARDLDRVWTCSTPSDGLQLMSVRVAGEKREPLDHAELLEWPLETRVAARDSQSWRIHYYQRHSRAGIELGRARRLMRLAYLLIGADPVLLNLTAYKYSSVSGVHQDALFYHLHPMHAFVGIWLAGEDVSDETGPLLVWPGSHRTPIWPGFKNYPQTNYRTCHGTQRTEQFNYMRGAVRQEDAVALPVKRGTAIFTHGLLVHAAQEPEVRGERSRFSLVLHYTTPLGNRIDDVEGPFNY